MKIESGEQEISYKHLTTGRSKAAIRGVVWSSISNFVPTILGFCVFIASSRVLTTREFGIVAFSTVVVTVFTAFCPFGLGEALVREKNLKTIHLDTIFWFVVLFGLSIYAVLYANSNYIAYQFGDDESSSTIRVIGLRVIFDSLGLVPNALLSRSMSFRSIAIRGIVSSSCAAALCILLLYLRMGYWALVASQVLSAAVISLGAWSASGWRPRLRFSLRSVRDLLKYGAWASANFMISIISLDQLFIGSFIGSSQYGLYGFARRIFQLATGLMTGAINAVSYSLLSSLQEEKAKLKDATLLAIFAASLVAFPAFCGLALVARYLIPTLFGDKWLPALPILQALCVVAIVLSIDSIQSSLIRSQGKVRFWIAYQAMDQILSIIIVVSIHSYGAPLIAQSLAFKSVMIFPFSIWLTLDTLQCSLSSYLRQMIPATCGTTLMALVVLIVNRFATFSTLEVGLLAVSLGGIVYITAVLLIAGPKLRQLY
ncbi:lipopolysaccharide biosynthesis protein [Rhizobium rhododendri]|uniref:Lipopolysaccharide biosynthesis protein n=1 Tax=Rhizobium rhododendri TaxID=2506430 RepID=A0ABY8IS97_9HYPH|nr:lipopolysaccharide biosynthesis protein [Rhizobium rhododendri]WFS26062.1 lipopolysaccharide biosynthesis protein [Rhizobium rhododendri]